MLPTRLLPARLNMLILFQQLTSLISVGLTHIASFPEEFELELSILLDEQPVMAYRINRVPHLLRIF